MELDRNRIDPLRSVEILMDQDPSKRQIRYYNDYWDLKNNSLTQTKQINVVAIIFIVMFVFAPLKSTDVRNELMGKLLDKEMTKSKEKIKKVEELKTAYFRW